MDRRTGKIEMVNEEVMRRMEAISDRANLLKEIQENLLPPKKQHQLQTRGKTKIGRNDPCPCGAMKEDGKTRKKFKKCCLVSSSNVSPLLLDSGFGTMV